MAAGKKPRVRAGSPRAFSASPYYNVKAGQPGRPGLKCNFGLRYSGLSSLPVPGPGTFCVDTNVEDRLARYRPAPKFSFGTAARLTGAERPPEHSPGPADYSSAGAVSSRSARGPSFTSRPPARGDEKRPGPGAHDLKGMAATASPRIITSMSPRFSDEHFSPGPTDYASDGLRIGRGSRRRDLVFGSTPRCTFGAAPARSTTSAGARGKKPGPGAHDVRLPPSGPRWSFKDAGFLSARSTQEPSSARGRSVDVSTSFVSSDCPPDAGLGSDTIAEDSFEAPAEAPAAPAEVAEL